MKMAQSGLGSIGKEIHCLDSIRVSVKVKSLLALFHHRGVDLNARCGSTMHHTACWIARHLPDFNNVLCTVSVQVVEHEPGAFTMSSVSNDEEDNESSFLESAILAYWLLRSHRCIKRLELAGTVVFLTNFPTLLCKALRANKGLEQIQIDTTHVWDVWHGIHVFSVLASTLASLSLQLKSLDIQNFVTSNTALQNVASTIRSGAVDRLVAWNGMSRRTASKLLRAVGNSSRLNVLEMQGTLMSSSRAILLATALKGNTTLQKLSVSYLSEDVAGIILGALKDNTTLQELSLLYSHDLSNSTLWDGFQALRTNTSLKCLKLVQTFLTNSCAIVIAEVLQENNVLQELYISDNPISDLGARVLAKALKKNTSLKRLDVSNCRLTEDVLSTFVKSLARNDTVECVRLGDISVSEKWIPPFFLTASVCERLHVAWNSRALEQWAICIPQDDDHSCSKLSLAWTEHAGSYSVARWCYASLVNYPLLTELVITCPDTLTADCVQALTSLLEITHSLKKFTLGRVSRRNCVITQMIYGLSENNTLHEAVFHHHLYTTQDVKALKKLLRTNRTLHRLKFKSCNLSRKAFQSLAHALKDNFVFLSLEFDCSPTLKTYPLLCALNRNQSLLNRAVECVLKSSVDIESMQALRLLSTCDSFLDSVAAASGRAPEECKRLVQEAERRMPGIV